MIFSKAPGLITVSKTMRKVIQKMLNNRKTIDVIQPGIDDVYLRNNQDEPKNYNLICMDPSYQEKISNQYTSIDTSGR